MQFFSSLSASVHLTTERSDEVYEYLLAIFFLTLHVPRQAMNSVYDMFSACWPWCLECWDG